MNIRLQIYNGEENKPRHGDKFISFQEVLELDLTEENRVIIQEMIDNKIKYLGVSISDEANLIEIINELCEMERASDLPLPEGF